MTKQEGAIISAYTGIMVGSFQAMHEYVEGVMGRPVFSHEFGNRQFLDTLKEKVRPDLIKICESLTE